MARIKIKDLPKDLKVSKEELKRIRGGIMYIAPSIRYGKMIKLYDDDLYIDGPYSEKEMPDYIK